MTTELTKVAQQALEALRNAQQLEHLVDRKMQRAAIAALERALTQRPVAHGLPELVQWHKEQAHGWRYAAMTSAADKVEPCRSSLLRMADFHESAAQAIASLPARPPPAGHA